MSDTPEIDEVEKYSGVKIKDSVTTCGDESSSVYIPVIFARQFERERDEARESLKHIGEYGTEEINAAIDLRQKLASALVERDEAIRQRNETNESSVFSCNFYYEEKLKAERERDEARDTNKKLREVLEWIAERYDDSKPMHQVAMDAYEMSCAARAILQKE